MSLALRLAAPADHEPLTALVLASFAPITWQKPLDERYGPLNGCDWQARWRLRLEKIYATQIVLVGEAAGELAAMASAAIDAAAALAYLDVLAVGPAWQGRGYGRQMLRGMLDHLRSRGCQYVHLDCLTNNEAGNALYASEGFEEVARHIRWFRKLE